MSSEVSPPPPLVAQYDGGKSLRSSSTNTIEEEWVEIVEPKSKTKIYANLDSGVCSKSPPQNVIILKTEDFDNHWWELYDKNSGKYYYYNPDQQKTVWTKPTPDGLPTKNGSVNGDSQRRRLLIIPVSKLQTFRRISPNSETVQAATKCDASTQTIASNLATVGTQTVSEKELLDFQRQSDQQVKKLSPTLRQISSNQTSRISSKIAEYQNVFMPKENFKINHRVSEATSRNRAPFLKSSTISTTKVVNTQDDDEDHQDSNEGGKVEDNLPEGTNSQENRSSQTVSLKKKAFSSFDNIKLNQGIKQKEQKEEISTDYFDSMPPPPPTVAYQKHISNEQETQQRSNHKRDSTLSSSFRPDDSSLTSSTITTVSTLKNQGTPKPQGSAILVHHSPDHGTRSNQQSSPRNDHKQKVKTSPNQKASQQVVTNNLSHYLVREARAMGIALISDEELDDDDQDSDDECLNDDDEDTDLRDDLSSNRGLGDDMSASQDLGEDSSEGGWRSFSDQESPNVTKGRITDIAREKHPPTGSSRQNKYKLKHARPKEPMVPKTPLLCETASLPFRNDNNELIDDQKDPVSCMSQQLDHRKLVENFKKNRQSSALGFNDSLSRSYRLEANSAVQRLKTVADTYFNGNSGSVSPAQQSGSSPQDKDLYKTNERYLRHLSTLSTLPRPIKAKPPHLPPEAEFDLDADYDVVEENCVYYNDAERLHANQEKSRDSDSASQLDNKNLSRNSRENLPNDTTSAINNYFDRNKSTRGSTFSVESFARENLTRHPKKGGLLFNRKVKWSRMICWTKSSIKQPMISSVSPDLAPDSIASFKLIQEFMGDRKITLSKKFRRLLTQSGLTEQEISSIASRKPLARSATLNTSGTSNSSTTSSSLGGGMTQISATTAHSSNFIPDRLRDELAFELVVKGCAISSLRDEIFVQLARQLTENPNTDSTNWGLVLMSILLCYFSPSRKFAPFLLSFLETHSYQMARDVCLPRLEKRLRQNWLSYCRKPADGKEVSIVRLSITKWPQYCGVFGESLDRVMSLQACSPYLKTLRLPWILTTLGDKLIETGADETEGIFRCAADHDLLAQLRLEIDCVDFRKITDPKQLKSLLSNVDDPHVIAGLLKLFFRQLLEPVFPSRMYDACLLSCHDATVACRLFNERLPNLNKDVVAYLIKLLQMLSKPDKVLSTKMDIANLSMVWAPNLLRAPEETSEFLSGSNLCDTNTSKSDSKWSISNSGGGGDDPAGGAAAAQVGKPTQSQSMIFEQTRQEMQFIKLLITNLDTSFITDVL